MMLSQSVAPSRFPHAAVEDVRWPRGSDCPIAVYSNTDPPKLVWRFPQPSEYRCSHGRRRGALFVARQEGRHLNRQIADLDGARTLEAPATGNLRTAGAINAQTAALVAAVKLRTADDERRQAKRNSLADKLTVEANTLADLKIEKAAVEGERRTVEADLGPVRYLATLIGQPDVVVMRWFILAVALLLDPAAVLLLL